MFRYALAFAAMPFAASAATVEITDLTPFEVTLAGATAYAIDINSLGLTQIASVTFRDDDSITETSGATEGFDVDAIQIGSSFGDASAVTASSYDFTNTSGATNLIGTDGSGNLDNSVATLETFDATVSPLDGFLSIGNGGILTAFFDPAVVVDGSMLFILTSDVGDAERLEFLSISDGIAAVPLPAGGMLLLSGLGAAAMMRRKRK